MPLYPPAYFWWRLVYTGRIPHSCFISSVSVKSSSLYSFQFNKDSISVNWRIWNHLNTFFFSLISFHSLTLIITPGSQTRIHQTPYANDLKSFHFSVCLVNLNISIFFILIKKEILCFIPSFFCVSSISVLVFPSSLWGPLLPVTSFHWDNSSYLGHYHFMYS